MTGFLRRRWTLRTRLTAVYGSLFLLAGTVMLGVTFLLVSQTMPTTGVDEYVGAVSITTTQSPSPTRSLTGSGSVVSPGQGGPNSQTYIPDGDTYTVLLKFQDAVRHAALQTMLTRGAVALVVVGAIAVWLGWLIAGRTLRPLQQVTATARRVADHNLHERIALAGPADELKELADTFDSMLERLARAFDGQRRFVANASHELRTPLAINRTILEVTLAQPDTPTKMHHIGTTLLEVNARHEKLIDGLLMLARSERELSTRTAIDLAGIAAHVADQARNHAPDAPAGVRIYTDLAPAPATGDPVLLERLAQNLVENALRYNTTGGQITITTGQRGGDVELCVTNSGPVVADYEIPGLFEPFRRLTDRVGSEHGTGLGLSIVAAIARAHLGNVTATARDGGGLTFTVRLPADTHQGTEAPPGSHPRSD